MSEMKTWPSLVGKSGKEAKKQIKKDDSSLQVNIIPHDHAVTCDFRTDRVNIFLDAEGKVTRPPMIG